MVNDFIELTLKETGDKTLERISNIDAIQGTEFGIRVWFKRDADTLGDEGEDYTTPYMEVFDRLMKEYPVTPEMRG